MNVAGLLLIVCLSGINAEHGKLVEVMSVVAKPPNSNDFGVATNCGKSDVTAIWSPRDLSPISEVTIYANITVPYDIHGGYAEVDIYNHADGSVFAEYGTPFSCDEAIEWIPCPLKQKQFLSLNRTITDLSVLAQYPGTFDIVILINNDDEQQILCLNATIHVTR